MGYFNSYTGIEAEFPDLRIFFQFAVQYHEVTRIKKEQINVWGRKFLVLCVEHGLMVAYGRLGNDKGRGEFTCLSGPTPILYIIR